MDDARKASIGPGTVVLGLGKDWSDIDCFWNDSIPALIHFNRFYPVFGAGKGSIFNYSLGVVNNTPHPELRLFGNKQTAQILESKFSVKQCLSYDLVAKEEGFRQLNQQIRSNQQIHKH